MAFVAWRDFDARSILALGGPWTRNLEKLAAARRMELKADDIKPYAWPDGFAEERVCDTKVMDCGFSFFGPRFLKYVIL